MRSVTRKDILQQLKYDLIGKDSYRGITLTYAWLANQFGHFALGFIPGFFVFLIMEHYAAFAHNGLAAALSVSGFWLLFETYNCLGPLLLQNTKKYTFTPAWKNIAFDTITDVAFFSIGAFTAGMLCQWLSGMLIVILALVAAVLYPSYYWYVTKMYQQAADYPFQFRLSQWAADIDPRNKEAVLKFLDCKDNGCHLFVFGGFKAGKTSLSVGMANELSIRHHTCMYVTAMKLFSLFFDPESTPANGAHPLWNWRQASFLVIDDINPGLPVEVDLVNPSDFLRFLHNNGMGEQNQQVIREKNIIWVLGNDEAPYTRQEKWVNMLTSIGVAKDKISTINLSHNI